MIPTADRRGMGSVYESVIERLDSGGERNRFIAGFADKGVDWIAFDRSVRPRAPRGAAIVPTLTGARPTERSVREAVIRGLEIVDRERRHWGSDRVRVAIPALGAGEGRGRDAGKLARAQVEQLREELDKRSKVDVVIVARSASAYARFVSARGGSLPKGRSAERIAPLIRNERVVLFIGAGVSLGAGLPDWKGLMGRFLVKRPDLREELRREWADRGFVDLMDKLDRNELPSGASSKDCVDVADRFVSLAGSDAHFEVIDEVLGGAATMRDPSTLAQYLLLQMPFRYVVTTNFDSMVERTLTALRKRPKVVVSSKHVAMSGEPGRVTVFKIHGSAAGDDRPRAEDIVFTTSEFKSFPDAHPAKAALLQALLLNHHFMFVGYGHGDRNLASIRETVSAMLAGTQRAAWATAIKESPGSAPPGMKWETFQTERDLDIWLDGLAAHTAAHDAVFLADREWSGESKVLGPVHAALHQLADGKPGLRAAFERPERWTLEEVRVLARMVGLYADLGWRDPNEPDLPYGWWSALGRGAERHGDLPLALTLWRNALAEAQKGKHRLEAEKKVAELESSA